MSATKKSAAPRKKPASSSHPPFADMIKECIIAHPSDARAGVSRPTIKKFLETRYGLDINASTVTNINRAITTGAEKGVFALPKGPSGKVKLSPKGRSDTGKENAPPAPPAKPKVAKKPKAAGAKPKPAGKPARKAPAAARPKKAGTTLKRPATAKKPAAPAKKTKPAAKPVKKATTKKAARPAAAAKKASAKRAPAKKSITGTKSRSAAAKPKPAAKKAGAASAKRKAPTKRV